MKDAGQDNDPDGTTETWWRVSDVFAGEAPRAESAVFVRAGGWRRGGPDGARWWSRRYAQDCGWWPTLQQAIADRLPDARARVAEAQRWLDALRALAVADEQARA